MEGLYDGPIFYTPIVNEMYYEVVVMDIAVDSQSLGMDCLEVCYLYGLCSSLVLM